MGQQSAQAAPPVRFHCLPSATWSQTNSPDGDRKTHQVVNVTRRATTRTCTLKWGIGVRGKLALSSDSNKAASHAAEACDPLQAARWLGHGTQQGGGRGTETRFSTRPTPTSTCAVVRAAKYVTKVTDKTSLGYCASRPATSTRVTQGSCLKRDNCHDPVSLPPEEAMFADSKGCYQVDNQATNTDSSRQKH